MTDLEKFIELYKSFGIELAVEEEEDNDGRKIQVIYLGNGRNLDSKLQMGYTDFFSGVYFDLSGNFLGQGFWE